MRVSNQTFYQDLVIPLVNKVNKTRSTKHYQKVEVNANILFQLLLQLANLKKLKILWPDDIRKN